jgi:hypothetical protein
LSNSIVNLSKDGIVISQHCPFSQIAMLLYTNVNRPKYLLIMWNNGGIFTNYGYDLLKRYFNLSNCHASMSKCRFNLSIFVLLCQIVISSCRNVVMTCLKYLSFCQGVILFCEGSVLITLNIVLLWRNNIFPFQMWCLLVETQYYYVIQWRWLANFMTLTCLHTVSLCQIIVLSCPDAMLSKFSITRPQPARSVKRYNSKKDNGTG